MADGLLSALGRVLRLGNAKMLKHKVSITDVAVLSNAYRIAVATTNRDLAFYELGTGNLCNSVIGIGDVITSLHYHGMGNDHGYLTCGDMAGNLFAFHFQQCSKKLFDPDAGWADGTTVRLKSIPFSGEAPALLISMRVCACVAPASLQRLNPPPSFIFFTGRTLTTAGLGSHDGVPACRGTLTRARRWIAAYTASPTNLDWKRLFPAVPSAVSRSSSGLSKSSPVGKNFTFHGYVARPLRPTRAPCGPRRA